MHWMLAAGAIIGWTLFGLFAVNEAIDWTEGRLARRRYNSVEARRERIARLETDLGIVNTLYAFPPGEHAVATARYVAMLPVDQQKAIEATRERRKAVARTAAQKRERRRRE